MLGKKYRFADAEKKWQRFWEEEKIFQFDPAGTGPVYSIDTPPPTVSGSIHIGHVYSYTHTEILARFWRLKGHRVFYPFGFDDNGLPTERLVEKETNQKAIELKRETFTKRCLQTTAKYEAQFKDLWQSLGFSVDWDLEYSTIDEKSQKTSQLSFLDLYAQGKVYRQQSPVLWCTECQTSIAQAEVDVLEKETHFYFLHFATTDGEKLPIATTRPELIPACVALLVHPEDARYQGLIGKTALIPLLDEEIPILADEDVDSEKGTGMVMCCTFGDQQDLIWWKRHQLPLKEMIGPDGLIQSGYGAYSGLQIKEARRKIIDDLQRTGRLMGEETFNHQVAHHERCGHPVEYISSRQWFIKIMEEKETFLELADQINWYPSYMKHRYLEWVNNLQWDWCISRQRYFGVPFPIWYCADCGAIILADQEDLPVNPLQDQPGKACSCGSNNFIPERDVMDTWATSSVTPLINAGWQGDGECEYPIFPMSLRPQAHDIIRTWTFYTIVKQYYHLGRIPWKNIMISGYVMASPGEKISKSKGNAKGTPQELIQEYSADVIRLWTAQAKLGTDIYFTTEELKNNQRLPIKLWNASRFVLGHLKDFTGMEALTYEPMDRWILDRFTQTHQMMDKYLERYEISQAKGALEKFFWNDFCDNYLELVKERLYKPEKRGDRERKSAQQTLYICLLNILKMYGIFTPHITEEIYQAYFREREGVKSLHLLDWDRYTEFAASDEIKAGGAAFIEIATQVRRFKSERGISLGTELAHLTVYSQDIDFLQTAIDDLKAVTRANEIEFRTGQDELKVEIQS